MKIKRANTIIYCKRWPETVQFYQQKLALAVTFANDWFVEFRLNDGACLSVANEARASVESSGGQGITVCFQVDDLPAIRQSLIAVGIDPTPIKKLWESNVFYVTDPEGTRLEFWS